MRLVSYVVQLHVSISYFHLEHCVEDADLISPRGDDEDPQLTAELEMIKKTKKRKHQSTLQGYSYSILSSSSYVLLFTGTAKDGNVSEVEEEPFGELNINHL